MIVYYNVPECPWSTMHREKHDFFPVRRFGVAQVHDKLWRGVLSIIIVVITVMTIQVLIFSNCSNIR